MDDDDDNDNGDDIDDDDNSGDSDVSCLTKVAAFNDSISDTLPFGISPVSGGKGISMLA